MSEVSEISCVRSVREKEFVSEVCVYVSFSQGVHVCVRKPERKNEKVSHLEGERVKEKVRERGNERGNERERERVLCVSVMRE